MTGYTYKHHLFDCIGVELEYMIVDADTLDVRPITDELLKAVCGAYESEVEPDGPDSTLSWSNELTLHVVELKTNGPAPSLSGLARPFQRDVQRINALLKPMNARLMPTAMHPWMNPDTEMRLWPHEYSPVYEAYNRIFDCRGHGWANLQSTHINLPFGNDDEFGRLHAAIRLVLPIIPALAASSPIADGAITGWLDTRMNNYKGHAKRIQSVVGHLVPEPIFTRAGYQRGVLQRMYDDVKPYDPEGVLQHEFLNARGGMARFDRGAIEIRVVDIQECPAADIAVAAAIVAVVRALADERWASFGEQCAWEAEPLYHLLMSISRDAERATIADERFLRLFGWNRTACTAGDLCAHLISELIPADDEHRAALDVITSDGPLARRMLSAIGESPARADLTRLYTQLCDCLAEGRMLRARG